jgi:hypothetical protein
MDDTQLIVGGLVLALICGILGALARRAEQYRGVSLNDASRLLPAGRIAAILGILTAVVLAIVVGLGLSSSDSADRWFALLAVGTAIALVVLVRGFKQLP